MFFESWLLWDDLCEPHEPRVLLCEKPGVKQCFSFLLCVTVCTDRFREDSKVCSPHHRRSPFQTFEIVHWNMEKNVSRRVMWVDDVVLSLLLCLMLFNSFHSASSDLLSCSSIFQEASCHTVLPGPEFIAQVDKRSYNFFTYY